jgi:hypothetical protein
MKRPWLAASLAAAVVAVFVLAEPARACPFCSAVSKTFREEIESMDAVVIARLLDEPVTINAAGPIESDMDIPRLRFAIEQIIKGEKLLAGRKTIESPYFGDGKKGQSFLLMGIDPPALMWSTPLAISDRVRDYIGRIPTLPDSPERLRFYVQYLEDKEELLTRDAYDEFANAPLSDVESIQDAMDHDKIIGWINDVDIPASRRRLYFVMLGVCGTAADVPMLESMLRSDDRKVKAGLDAMISCYLTLKGSDGLALVDELYMANPKADFADTYSAIMAIQFQGSELEIIPRERLLVSVRHVLKRPQLADLVIPILARWEDWAVMPLLVDLFKNADDESSWVRVPVINYLRACPLPEAKKYLDELAKIDPAAMKRANAFFPFGAGAPSAAPPAPGDEPSQTGAPGAVPSSSAVPEVPGATPAANVAAAPQAPADENARNDAASRAGAGPVAERSVTGRPRFAPPVAQVSTNPWLTWGVMAGVGCALLFVMWMILARSDGQITGRRA